MYHYHYHFSASFLILQALQFLRSLDDVEERLDSVEAELSQTDCGEDLASVSRLLKDLQGLEDVVDGHREKVQNLVDTAKNLSYQGNFQAREIQQQVWHMANRYLMVRSADSEN